MRQILLIFTVLLTCFGGFAEAESTDTVFVSSEFGQTASSGSHTPFWLSANRQGLSSIDKGYGYVEVGAFKKMDRSRRFSWGAGVDIAVPWKFTSHFVVQQLYAEAKYRSLSISIGSRNISSDMLDPELSSGSLLFSGNARPVPQVRVGIMEFQPFKFTDDWVSIKGHLAYGKFTDSSWQQHWSHPGSRYSKGALMCARGFWLKGGDEKRFPLTLTVGVEMATEFAGTIYNYDLYNAHRDTINVKMPSGPRAWIKALIPMPGDPDTLAGERTNVEGNTVGAYDFCLTWTPYDSDWKVKAYWQHMFEDHSMLWIQFPWKDGLWGLQGELPRNPILSSVVYEFMYSKYQSGPVYNDSSTQVPEQVSGVDRYYNHDLYPGWMHWGMALGNPFFVSPIYNSDHILQFYATRNISHHIGLKGNPMPGLEWRVLASNTRSWGDYLRPFPEIKEMWNFLAEVKWRPAKLSGFQCMASVAFDRGDLIGNNFGVALGVRYELPVTFKSKVWR